MANLRGKGAWTSKDMIVKISTEPVKDKDGNEIKGRFVEVQMDQSNYNPATVETGKNKMREIPPQKDPYLVTNEVTKADGNKYLSHNAYYTPDQVDKIVKGAGDKHFSMTSPTTGKSYDVYGINASLMVAHKGDPEKQKVIINTKKEITETTNKKFDENILTRQFAVTKAASAFAKANPQTKASEQEAANVAEAPAVDNAVEATEPDFEG